MKEVDGIFSFRVFHKEWPSSLDKDGEGVEEATWDVGFNWLYELLSMEKKDKSLKMAF